MTTQAVALFTYTNNYFFFGVRAPVFYVCVYKKKSRKTSDHCCSLGHYFWMCFLFLSLSSVHRCTSAVSNLFSFFFLSFDVLHFLFFCTPITAALHGNLIPFHFFFVFGSSLCKWPFPPPLLYQKIASLPFFDFAKKKITLT